MLCLTVFLSSRILAADRLVSPGSGTLQRAIDQSASGDRLLLNAGEYKGQIIINRSLELVGTGSSIIDGGGKGRVIMIMAPDVTVRGVIVQQSGTSLATEDSGIFITSDGDRAVIENNQLRHNLIGINLKGPENALVRHNVITGSTNPRMNERGNGVQLWNTPGSVVENNDIRFGRDGIFVTTSRDNIFHGNKLRELRFGIHYMYTHDSRISSNQSVGNHAGFALMFSDRLEVIDNISTGDRDHGLFLNYANYSEIIGNRVAGGSEKCLFIYNANVNRIRNNIFSECQIGIHFTAGSDRNLIYENAFVNNRTQVKYVGTRHIEWSLDGRGNYWSDNPAFDLDDNGIADQPYRPNDLMDQVIWRHPIAKLLLNSPAAQLLRWAQSEFPSLFPGGISDSTPLMSIPGHPVLPDG